MAARVHDINEKVTGNGRGVSVYLLSSRWKSEGFILRRRSFLLDEKTPRRDERMARERQNKEKERQRGVVSDELGEDCHESGKRKEKTTKRGKGGRRRTPWKMDGEGRSAALSENGQDK